MVASDPEPRSLYKLIHEVKEKQLLREHSLSILFLGPLSFWYIAKDIRAT